MIQTKRDLKFYMTEDARALGYDKLPFFKRFIRVHFDKRIKFHIELRKFEYCSNRLEKLKWWGKLVFSPMYLYHFFVFKRLSYILGH